MRGRAKPGSGRTYLSNADGILAAWRDCMYAESEEDFKATWLLLCREFDDQPLIVDYLRNYWLPVAADFAQYSISEYRNFGIRVTSRTECAHWLLKRLLRKKRVDLVSLFLAILCVAAEQKESYSAKLTMEEMSTLPQWLGARESPTTNKLFKLVSHYAMGIITQNVKRASDWLGGPETSHEPCTGRFEAQHGLPCWHAIRDLKLQNRVLALEDIDPHHHLKRQTVCAIPSPKSNTLTDARFPTEMDRR